MEPQANVYLLYLYGPSLWVIHGALLIYKMPETSRKILEITWGERSPLPG